MNLNAFNQSIVKSYEVADRLGLSPSPISLRSIRNTIDVSELEGCQSYAELYRKIVDARNLNFFVLQDDFFQFSHAGGSYRYAYHASPFVEYREPLTTTTMDEGIIGEEVIGLDDIPVPEPQIDGSGFVVRYEYSEDQYHRLTHPCAHIHFGWNKSGRLAAKRIWTPLVFTLFVLRHLHSMQWFEQRNMENDMDGYTFDQMFKARRDELSKVHVAYFHEFEEKIAFID